jgi:hypothetical protein
VKKAIPDIVDADQTGFVHGRHIAENFVYVADLLRCCYSRGAPTDVLKLDFKKAFDSVSWCSLDKILAARGFDAKWRSWVSLILSSGETAVVWTSLGPLPRWVPGLTTRWAPGTTRLVPHGT